MTKILFALIAAAAGVATSLQSAANAGLASRIGLGAALILNTLMVLVGTVVFYLLSGRQGTFFPAATPWFLYIGGLCGFVVILSLAFVFPKIGAGVTIAILVLGQGAAALAIDHFGVMGMPKEPLTLARLAGMLLACSGVALMRV
ncbi:MAG: DMT family transporter [Pirellulales bacterium]